jgi:2-succinyl-5-enolpyruvyl-6-hydroxy-3-cyclohexene-1-carboxylate synthase
MTTARWNQLQGQALVDGLLAAGVRHAVVSPGSRNTPIVLAIAQRAEQLDIHVVLDERSAAFLGLGLSRQSGAPTLLCCTSGSALAHYLPAVIEASEAGIPLIICSADRPPELHGCGAPQSIDQEDVLSSHARGRFDAEVPEDDGCGQKVATLATQAMDLALGPDPGPVHINLPFREPLWSAELEPVGAAPVSAHDSASVLSQLTDEERAPLRDLVLGAQRGLIVCGHRETRGRPEDDNFPKQVLKLAKALNWPLIAEPSSGVRFGTQQSAPVICHADSLLRSATGQSWSPDVILRFGRNPTSKPVYQWLAKQEQARQQLIDPRGRWNDPGQVAEKLWAVDEARLCDQLRSDARAGDPQTDPEWCALWKDADQIAAASIAERCADAWWEGSVAHHLITRLPEASLLHVANSMPIRDVDGLAPTLTQNVDVFANRGANGIDGTIATFLGETRGRERGLSALLIGDLAFLHDANSLALAPQVQRPSTIIVVDNGGGGIFQYLPIAQNAAAFETYFTTPQSAGLEALCAAHAIPYVAVADLASYTAQVGAHLERPGVSVIHARVNAKESHDLHQALWAEIDTLITKKRPGGGVE